MTPQKNALDIIIAALPRVELMVDKELTAAITAPEQHLKGEG